MENQQFHEADQQFDKVLELDPTNASVYVHKGMLMSTAWIDIDVGAELVRHLWEFSLTAMAQFQVNHDADKMIKTLRDSLKMDDRNEFVYETLGTLELQS